ncbi:MAG: beta-propeller fold lactonase family protein [Pseudomonadota bacterium]
MPKASFIAQAAILFGPLAVQPALASDRDLRGELDFQGRYLVSVSDADMVASAYVDGQLGPREGRDALSVIALDGDPRGWQAAETFASNSVAGPPAVVDVTPDGRYAFVIETWRPRPDNDDPHTFGSLTHGNLLKVFDLADPRAPVLVQEIETLERPDAVRVSSDGAIVAVAFNPSGAGAQTPLALYSFSNGRLGAPVTPSIADWDPASNRLMDIDWHPSAPVLSMIDEAENTVRFARVAADMTVEPFGNIVDVERTPFRVEFTPDGNHVVINALYWGPDIQGRWSEAPRGSVLTVRMNAETSDDGTVRHAFVSRVMTGVSPEGLAVSPDGRWVVTTNLERSYLPYDDARITWFSSITLAALDQATGQLSEVGTFNYDGILPEAAVFDNSGNYLAVANYDHFDDRRTGSSIDFWRIQADPLDAANVQLIKTEHSVPVTRGAHSMVIAR